MQDAEMRPEATKAGKFKVFSLPLQEWFWVSKTDGHATKDARRAELRF